MNVQELMTVNPVAVRTNSKVRDVLAILQEMEIRHLPVVNEDNDLVGMLSDRDLRSLSIPVTGPDADERARKVLDQPVSTHMSSSVLSVTTEEDVGDVIDLMLEHRVGAVPVVNADGALAGIVSFVDVLRVLRDLI